MRFLKNKSAATIPLTYSLLISTFTLFSMLCGPVYAGYSIFEFNFTNNTNYIIKVKRGINKPNESNDFANPPALISDTISPGQTSKKFVVGQRGGSFFTVSMYYKWFVSDYKSNHMFCSSVIIFQLTRLGIKTWRYGTIVRQNKYIRLCKGFKGVGAKKAYNEDADHTQDWGNKKLPNPLNKGYPRHYLINIPLGNKSS